MFPTCFPPFPISFSPFSTNFLTFPTNFPPFPLVTRGKAFTQATLHKKMSTFCPLVTEIWSKMLILQRSWPWNYVKLNGTIRFFDLKNIDLHTNIAFLSALLQSYSPRQIFANGTSHVQTVQNILLCYLVLKFGNILLISNWVMAQNVISQRSRSWNVNVIGQNKWHHRIPWPQIHRFRCQNPHPKCLSSKVMVKDVFLHNDSERSASTYVSLTFTPLKMFFDYWKASTQATQC